MSALFTERLLIHIDKIDEQHEKIFSLVEEFNTACLNLSDKKRIVYLFNELRYHAEQHFKYEEEEMIKYNYSSYGEHKESHNVYVRKMEVLSKTIRREYIPFTKLIEINEFFSEGFVTHLSQIDSKLGEFLREKL